MSSRTRPAVGLLLCAMSTSACADLGEGARAQFSRELSCPEARVEVRERPDLRYSQLFPADGASPPADLASDPERVAMWRANRAEERTELDATLDRLDMFEVRGCGARQLLGCGLGGDIEGGVDVTSVVCFKPPLQEAP
jgi:hypothetical protein